MPSSPEELCAVVVADTTNHVLWWVHSVNQRPKSEHSPGDQELEPNDMKVHERQHGQLCCCVRAPIRLSLADRTNPIEVKDYLHGQQHQEEADTISDSAVCLDTGRPVLGLRDVIVEGNDRSRQVERRIDGVCDVVAETKVSRFC